MNGFGYKQRLNHFLLKPSINLQQSLELLLFFFEERNMQEQQRSILLTQSSFPKCKTSCAVLSNLDFRAIAIKKISL